MTSRMFAHHPSAFSPRTASSTLSAPVPLTTVAATILLLAALPTLAQPSACTTAWTTFNPTVGPNGPVGGGICFHDGRLLMRGAFLSAGGVPATRVAMWDGMTWTDASQGFTMDPLVNNSVNNMVSAFGNVYAAGNVPLPPNPLPRSAPGLYWNGTSWQPTPNTGLVNGRSVRLNPTGGKLYSYGTFGFPGPNGVQAFSRSLSVMNAQSVWSTVGPTNYDINSTVANVQSIVEFGGDVFIAGNIPRIDHLQLNPQHITVNNIARLSSSQGGWFNAGFGVNAFASLIEFQGILYAWGNFTATGDNVEPLPRFARWTGFEWRPVGDGLGAGFSALPSYAFVGDDSRGPAIFFWFTGTATNVAPGYPPTIAANGLVRFDGLGFTAVAPAGSPNINGFTSGELRHSGPAVYAAMNNVNLGTGGPGHFARLGRAVEVDADADGLPDEWERPGGGLDVNCDGTIDLRLWDLGASDQHKDLFVEIDAMMGQAPDLNTITLVQEALNNAPVSNPDGFNGIRLHTFVDEGNLPVEHFPDGLAGLRRIKRDHFGTIDDRDDPNAANILEAKRRVYRYALFASTYGDNSYAGVAEVPGNDLLVTLGHADWSTIASTQARASTFMHMLGHTLGLTHGGAQHDPNTPHRYNFKPNYHSVMNFSWQFPGRMGWTLDFSRAALPNLDELFLPEFLGLQGNPDARAIIGPPPCRLLPESGQLDFDRDNVIDLPFVAADVNHICMCIPASPGDTLLGHNDWANLRLNFRNTPGYLDQGAPITTANDEITRALYDTLQHCTFICPADFDDGSGSGTPDGGVTIDDLLYFLRVFEEGQPRADLDDGSGTGTRDGGVTIDDLLYFLDRFERGC